METALVRLRGVTPIPHFPEGRLKASLMYGELCVTAKCVIHPTRITPISIFPRQGGRGKMDSRLRGNDGGVAGMTRRGCGGDGYAKVSVKGGGKRGALALRQAQDRLRVSARGG